MHENDVDPLGDFNSCEQTVLLPLIVISVLFSICLSCMLLSFTACAVGNDKITANKLCKRENR